MTTPIRASVAAKFEDVGGQPTCRRRPTRAGA
jgi:hypothetical protein